MMQMLMGNGTKKEEPKKQINNTQTNETQENLQRLLARANKLTKNTNNLNLNSNKTAFQPVATNKNLGAATLNMPNFLKQSNSQNVNTAVFGSNISKTNVPILNKAITSKIKPVLSGSMSFLGKPKLPNMFKTFVPKNASSNNALAIGKSKNLQSNVLVVPGSIDNKYMLDKPISALPKTSSNSINMPVQQNYSAQKVSSLSLTKSRADGNAMIGTVTLHLGAMKYSNRNHKSLPKGAPGVKQLCKYAVGKNKKTRFSRQFMAAKGLEAIGNQKTAFILLNLFRLLRPAKYAGLIEDLRTFDKSKPKTISFNDSPVKVVFDFKTQHTDHKPNMKVKSTRHSHTTATANRTGRYTTTNLSV